MEKFRVHHFSFGMNTSNADRGSVTLGKLAHFLRQLKRLHRFLIRHQPDSVYYYFAQTRLGLMKDLLVMSMIRQKGRKILLHLRGGNFRRFYNGQPPWVRRVIRSNLRQGDKVLVQSECLTDMFHGLVPNSRIGVLYNGLELKDLAKQMSSSGQRNGKVVFFLGQLSYAKGYFDLLLVIPKIASQVDTLRVFLAGEHIPLSAERNIHLHYISNPETRSETVRQAKKIEQDYSDVIRYVGGHRRGDPEEDHGPNRCVRPADLLGRFFQCRAGSHGMRPSCDHDARRCPPGHIPGDPGSAGAPGRS